MQTPSKAWSSYETYFACRSELFRGTFRKTLTICHGPVISLNGITHCPRIVCVKNLHRDDIHELLNTAMTVSAVAVSSDIFFYVKAAYLTELLQDMNGLSLTTSSSS